METDASPWIPDTVRGGIWFEASSDLIAGECWFVLNLSLVAVKLESRLTQGVIFI